MKNSVYTPFLCLTKDLGLRVRDNISLPQLQECKDALLQAAESVGTDGHWASSSTRMFFDKFDACFYRNMRYARPWRAAIFRDIYQVLSFPLKVETAYTPEQERKYLEKYNQNEASCHNWRLADHAHSELLRLARYCVHIAAGSWDLSPSAITGACRHGPGAVAQRYRGDDKFVFPTMRQMPYQLTSWCGHEPFYANDMMAYEDSILRPSCHDEPHRSGTCLDRVIARLSLVPKDWKGPRGVFISPLEAVWCQLGVWETIRRAIHKTWLSQCYDPSSQEPSRVLAYQGSISRSVATLDLSDASDRIPAKLVKYLFPAQDWAAFSATRPSAVMLPGECVPRHLHMFAPMGDGKTFPVLTIVSSALTLASVLKSMGYVAARPPGRARLWEVASRIRIFGDDIIVPSEFYSNVCKDLELCNLKVNTKKSYCRGYFRESCGMDAYRGVDVTPLKLRFEPVRRPDLVTTLKGVDIYNRIVLNRPDLQRTSCWFESYVHSSTKYKIGYSGRPDQSPSCLYAPPNRESGGGFTPLARNLYKFRNTREPRVRFSTDLQRWEVLVSTVGPQKWDPSVETWWSLNHWLLTRGAGLEDPSPTCGDLRLTAAAPVGSPHTTQWYERALGRQCSVSVAPRCRESWVAI